MDIRAGIVGIKSDPKSKTILGTGFFVPAGLILTCAHVIMDYYEPGRQIDCQLEGQTYHFKADVVEFSPKGEYDLAILKSTEEVKYAPLPISASQASKGNPFSIFRWLSEQAGTLFPELWEELNLGEMPEWLKRE
jgi:hypothetical protein